MPVDKMIDVYISHLTDMISKDNGQIEKRTNALGALKDLLEANNKEATPQKHQTAVKEIYKAFIEKDAAIPGVLKQDADLEVLVIQALGESKESKEKSLVQAAVVNFYQACDINITKESVNFKVEDFYSLVTKAQASIARTKSKLIETIAEIDKISTDISMGEKGMGEDPRQLVIRSLKKFLQDAIDSGKESNQIDALLRFNDFMKMDRELVGFYKKYQGNPDMKEGNNDHHLLIAREVCAVIRAGYGDKSVKNMLTEQRVNLFDFYKDIVSRIRGLENQNGEEVVAFRKVAQDAINQAQDFNNTKIVSVEKERGKDQYLWQKPNVAKKVFIAEVFLEATKRPLKNKKENAELQSLVNILSDTKQHQLEFKNRIEAICRGEGSFDTKKNKVLNEQDGFVKLCKLVALIVDMRNHVSTGSDTLGMMSQLIQEANEAIKQCCMPRLDRNAKSDNREVKDVKDNAGKVAGIEAKKSEAIADKYQKCRGNYLNICNTLLESVKELSVRHHVEIHKKNSLSTKEQYCDNIIRQFNAGFDFNNAVGLYKDKKAKGEAPASMSSPNQS